MGRKESNKTNKQNWAQGGCQTHLPVQSALNIEFIRHRSDTGLLRIELLY